MHTLSDALLAWEDAEEATIAAIKVLLHRGCRQAGELSCQLVVPSQHTQGCHHGRAAAHPQETLVGLAEHTEAVVAIGDPNHRVVLNAWLHNVLTTTKARG